MKLTAFIIHLTRAHARRDNVKRLISTCPIPATIHPAVDGHSLSKEQSDKVYKRQLHLPRYPFRLNPGEIGAFLSHKEVWQRILSEKIDAALIFEDDISIDPRLFNTAFNLAKRHIFDARYIQFPIKLRNSPARIIEENSNIALFENIVIPLGAVCQFVSSSAATILLKQSDMFDRPIDTLLQLRHISNLHVYTIYPNGIDEISKHLDGSYAHQSRNEYKWIEREWKRFKYRSHIKLLSYKSYYSEE